MDVKRVAAVAAMTAMVSFQSGCSFLFVKGPPANHAELASVECSDSYGWPGFDAIWAGLNGLGAATVGDDMVDNTGTAKSPSHDEVVAVGVTWLVVSGISAIYGFTKVAACREAKERHALTAGGPSPIASCRDQRARALEEAHREPNQRERMRMIEAAPVCERPDDRTPARAPAPAPAPVAAPPVAAPVAAPVAPAPAAAPDPSAPAPSPTSLRTPTRTRSLAMRR